MVVWEGRVGLRFDMLNCFVELIFYFIHNVNVDVCIYIYIDL